MKPKGVKILDNQYSQSAQKIRSILQESSVGQSKTSELTVSRKQNIEKVKQYLNFSRRLHYLWRQKQRTNKKIFFNIASRFAKISKSNQIVSLRSLTLICKQSMVRYKAFVFHKLLTNKLRAKSKQERQSAGLRLVISLTRQKQKWNYLFCLQRLRIKYLNTDKVIISNSQMMRSPRPQKQLPATQQQKQQPQFSLSLINPLKQLVVYDKATFVNLTLDHLQIPLQAETKNITNTRDLKGQQLLLIVLNNHIKAIVDLNNLTQINGSIHGNGNASRRSFNQKNNVAIYEDLGQQFFESDQQLNKLIILSNDIPKAQGAIQLAIKNYTARNYRFKNNKIIQSRVRLLELILSVLRQLGSQKRQKPIQMPPLQLNHKNTSFKQLEVSHVRLIVQQLDQKVYQLSTISEQIPQLQTFKRTLDLTMPQHNSYLTKIVDVLIQLHHKVNKLISRRPQKLLRQIQAVQQQCLIIEVATTQFITKLQSQVQVRLKPIYFDQRNNKSPDYFRKIQKNCVKLSQVIIECMDLQAQARQKMLQIKALIQVFWNLIAGMQQYQKQWKMYKNRQNKSADEQEIIQMLQLCLKFVNDRIEKMNQDFQIERQTLIDGNNKNFLLLQQEIAKLSQQNEEMRQVVGQLQKQNQQFRDGIKIFQQKYKDLVRKVAHDSDDYQTKINTLQKKQKNYKDKIQALQAENQQKKVMISNITNDLKRAMKQTQSSWKADQKNKDLEELINKLNLKIQQHQSSNKLLKLDLENLKNQKSQLEKNNELLIKKLEESNRKISDLQNQLEDLKYKNQRQKSRLKEDIQQLERLNKKLNHEVKLTQQGKYNQMQKKQNEFKVTVNKKDEKITQLTDKISELNDKLNQIVNNYKNMEFELKRKERNEQDLSSRLKQFQGRNNNEIIQLQENYQRSQGQLSNALAEIQRCRNRTVPDLETELRRREGIIAQMQKIINQLEQKQSAILDQEQNNANLRKLVDQLQDKLRQKDHLLHNKQKDMEYAIRQRDSKIKELQYSININNSKIGQFQTQNRIQNQQKNQKIRDLQNKARQLESKLINLQRQNSRFKQLQQKVRNYQKQIRSLRDNQRQYQRLKLTFQRKIKDQDLQISSLKSNSDQTRNLDNALKDATLKLQSMAGLQNQLRKAKQRQNHATRDLDAMKRDMRAKQDRINSLQNQLRQIRSNLNKIGTLEAELRSANYEVNRLKQAQNGMSNLNSKIMNLEAAVLDKSRTISDLQAKLRNYQNQQSSALDKNRIISDLQAKVKNIESTISDKNRIINDLQGQLRSLQNLINIQQVQLSKTRGLVQQLRNKQRQLSNLQQQKAALQANKQVVTKINDYIKQIQYLKQKIRSLEDLIDIFTEQHGILQAKIKQYRLRQANNKEKDSGEKYDKLNQQYNKTIIILKSKQNQLEAFKRKNQQLQSKIKNTPIAKPNLGEQLANKARIDNLQKQNRQLNRIIQDYQRQVRQTKENTHGLHTRYNQDTDLWKRRQKAYIQEISILKTELGGLQIRMKSLQGSKEGTGDKYYLRVQGQRLEQLIKRMQSGNWNLTLKLDEILSNSRKIEESSQISSNLDFQAVVSQNKLLIEQIRRIIGQKQELSSVVKQYPNPNFLTEYAFRIITYFSEIHPESPEGKCIWQQLQRIREQNIGQQYFIILQQFTKFTLQENAIQVYRRQLRDKAQQLEMLKAKLDIFFQQQLISEKRTYQKTALTQSRVAMFRQRLSQSSSSSFMGKLY